MKTWIVVCLAAIMLTAAPVRAAEDVVIPGTDEFGSNFTAQAPEALQDDLPDAEGLNAMAPAAGDSVAAGVDEASDMLPVPDTALVPGMEQAGPLPADTTLPASPASVYPQE